MFTLLQRVTKLIENILKAKDTKKVNDNYVQYQHTILRKSLDFEGVEKSDEIRYGRGMADSGL